MVSGAARLMELFEVSPSAQEDLFAIWDWIATDSVALADRIESEFYALFEMIGRTPRLGHVREDLTKRPILFLSMYSFLVAYRPAPLPVRIIAVVRGSRDVGRSLRGRS